MGTALRLDRLRRELEERFGRAILPRPGAEREVAPGFQTGVRALDCLLPRGVPRAALTLWTGEGTAGRTAALRALVMRACGGGATVGIVDAGRTLDPAFWCMPAGPVEGLWIVRPDREVPPVEGAWAAERLLRTGTFGLVVVHGTPPSPEPGHRLRALARERGVAMLISADAVPAGLRADVRVDFRQPRVRTGGLMPGGRFRRRVRVSVTKEVGSPHREGEVEVVYQPSHRLHPHSDLPDRSAGGG